jgi:hypothetical protein
MRRDALKKPIGDDDDSMVSALTQFRSSHVDGPSTDPLKTLKALARAIGRQMACEQASSFERPK